MLYCCGCELTLSGLFNAIFPHSLYLAPLYFISLWLFYFLSLLLSFTWYNTFKAIFSSTILLPYLAFTSRLLISFYLPFLAVFHLDFAPLRLSPSLCPTSSSLLRSYCYLPPLFILSFLTFYHPASLLFSLSSYWRCTLPKCSKYVDDFIWLRFRF